MVTRETVYEILREIDHPGNCQWMRNVEVSEEEIVVEIDRAALPPGGLRNMIVRIHRVLKTATDVKKITILTGEEEK